MPNEVIDNFVNRHAELSKKWLQKIETMLSSGHYSYAEDFLSDLYDQLEDGRCLSQNQIQAVKNIYNKPAYDRY